MDFDTTSGLILHLNSQKILHEVFPKISSFNPKIRFLIFLTGNVTEEMLKEIFLQGWTKYRIYDVFIIIDEEFKKFFHSFHVYSYNHFTIQEKKLVSMEITYKFQSGLKAMNEFKNKRFRNLNKYPLKVVLFRFMMVCDGETDESGNFKLETLKFQDAEALMILSKQMNFSIKFVKSSDGVNHGYQTSNKTFTGSLGMVEYEHADFAANARLVAEYNTSNTLCLFPTTTTKLKFSVPRKYWEEVNILASIFDFLDMDIKITLFAILIFVPSIIVVFDKILGIGNRRIFDSITSNYLLLYAIMTFVSYKLPKHWTSRWIIGGVIIIWLVIGNIYSGKMIEFLNTDSGLKQIKSIEEIMESDLIVKVPYPMAILFEGNFENTSKSHQFINKVVKESRKQEKARDKLAFIDIGNMDAMIRSKKYALLLLDNLIDHVEAVYYDKKGHNIMTHVEKTPYEYNYASSVPKTSPFVQSFNEILMRIFEAGLPKYQMNMAMVENDLIYIRRIKTGNVPNDCLKSISLNQLYSVFSLYFIMIGFSICAFIIEIVLYKFNFFKKMCLKLMLDKIF